MTGILMWNMGPVYICVGRKARVYFIQTAPQVDYRLLEVQIRKEKTLSIILLEMVWLCHSSPLTRMEPERAPHSFMELPPFSLYTHMSSTT